MPRTEPELPSARVVHESPRAQLVASAASEAREQAIKQLLGQNRLSAGDQAELDDHLRRVRSRTVIWKVSLSVIIGIALLYRALL